MRGRNAWMLSLGMGMAAIGTVADVHAEPPGPNAQSMHVVSIRTDDADAQAEALTSALKSEVRKMRGWSLAEGDFSLEVLALALRCPNPPDAACLSRIADQIKTDRYVWGTIAKGSDKRVSGSLHLWTRGQPETKAELSFSDNLTEPGDDALRRIAVEALNTLTGGVPKGTVRISTDVQIDGEVFVDGQPAGTVHDGLATVLVPVGSHIVEVRAPGRLAAQAEVDVQLNSSVGLSLSLAAKAGAGHQKTIEKGEAEQPSKPMNLHKLGGYGALAAGGGLVVGGLLSSLKVRSISNDSGFAAYRSGIRGNVCDAATNGEVARDAQGQPMAGASSPGDVNNQCSSAHTYQALQWVFYGLGAVSLGTGVYLLATDPERTEKASDSARVEVIPGVGPRDGSIDVRLTF